MGLKGMKRELAIPSPMEPGKGSLKTVLSNWV